jgi:hypothetical protein
MTKLPPPPAKNGTAPTTTTKHEFAITSGRISGPQRIVIFGPGGIGKSSLASLAPGAVALDLEHGTRELDIPRVEGLETWVDLRSCVQSSALDAYGTICVDTCTRAEEMAVAHTIATTPHEKGQKVTSIEGYGFGKGYQHVYDTFLLLLADLDSQIRRGRNIILICHDCVNDVPNPTGDNFIRFEPHLQDPKSGKASIRHRVIQWADHVLFIGYDVAATRDGKGVGIGTRTIYTDERPDHIAKSRTVHEVLPFNGPDDGAIWGLIFGQNGGGK